MQISLDNVGKKFHRQWVFRNVKLNIKSGDRMAVCGANGSGKSTLLKLISAALVPTEGNILYQTDGEKLPEEMVFRYVSFAAPYLELIEEYTLNELLRFHFALRKPLDGLNVSDVLDISGLDHAKDKYIRHYSSGMKQRLRLSLALLTDSRLLLLDEPLSNLDAGAADWYRSLMEQYGADRTILVGSNHQQAEYDFCAQQLNIEDFHF